MKKENERPELRLYKYKCAVMLEDLFNDWIEYEIKRKPEFKEKIEDCKEIIKDAILDGFTYGNQDAIEDTEENIEDLLRIRPELNGDMFKKIFWKENLYSFDELCAQK